jgi:hypothetical protein
MLRFLKRKKRNEPLVIYFIRNISTAVGLVLVWRGIWYVFDSIDIAFFEGRHELSAIIGFIAGILILYLPDGDLKEIEKL